MGIRKAGLLTMKISMVELNCLSPEKSITEEFKQCLKK